MPCRGYARLVLVNGNCYLCKIYYVKALEWNGGGEYIFELNLGCSFLCCWVQSYAYSLFAFDIIYCCWHILIFYRFYKGLILQKRSTTCDLEIIKSSVFTPSPSYLEKKTFLFILFHCILNLASLTIYQTAVNSRWLNLLLKGIVFNGYYLLLVYILSSATCYLF